MPAETMNTNNVLAILVLAIVVNLATPAHTPGITIGEFANLMMSGLFELPGSMVGLGYNTAGLVGTKFMDSIGCKVEPDEDEDACRNISQLIRSRGFGVEEHEVTTEDGYILGIQRVINPLVDPAYRPKMKPILLMHGVFSTSDNWVFQSLYARPTPWPPGPGQQQTPAAGKVKLSMAESDRRHPRSLAFYLANHGYDVWLGNFRGNFYCLKHNELSVVDPQFWDFSLDEQVDYDLPAMIRYIQQITGHKKMGFVGWSQGATIMFALQADHPEYADIIEPFVALGPVAFLHNTKTPAKLFVPLIPVAQGLNLGYSFSDLLRFVMQKICGPTPPQKLLCLDLAGQVYGDDKEGFEVKRFPTFLHHFPGGSSFKDVAHYAQLIMSHKFARYNWGVIGNLQKYGSVLPPDYNLAKIRSKSMVFFTGINDFLADPADVHLLVKTMGAKPIKWFNMAKEIPKWNHMDYVHHIRVGELVNRRIVEMMDQYRLRDEKLEAAAQRAAPASAQVPNQAASTQVANQVTAQMPGQVSAQMPNQMPAQAQIPGQMQLLGQAQMASQLAGPIAAQIPGQMAHPAQIDPQAQLSAQIPAFSQAQMPDQTTGQLSAQMADQLPIQASDQVQMPTQMSADMAMQPQVPAFDAGQYQAANMMG